MNTIVLRNPECKVFSDYLFDIYTATLDSLNTSQEFRPLPISDYNPTLSTLQPLMFRSMAISIKATDGKIILGYGLTDFVNNLIQAVLDGSRLEDDLNEAKRRFLKSVPYYSSYDYEWAIVEVGVVDNAPVEVLSNSLQEGLRNSPVMEAKAEVKPKKKVK